METTADGVEAITESLIARIGAIRTRYECEEAARRIVRIRELARQKNAVILVHNYQIPEIFHGVADFTGDSLALARRARETEADIMVFCGVHFMAETAKILNPKRLVLIPALDAGCSLAESITAEDVRAMKRAYPGLPVVCYVNCSAAVKAESDVCCTSANASKIIRKVEGDRVIFIPDEYLARNVERETGKTVIRWPGRCMVHEKFTAEDVRVHRRSYPDLFVLAHPECSPDVVGAADFSGSTSAMISALGETPRKNVLLLTECSMGDNVREKHPDKNFVTTCMVCPHMKRITLENLEDALRFERYEVTILEDVRVRAQRALDRMLELSA